MDPEEKIRRLRQEEDFLKRHKHAQKNFEDYLEFEQKVKPPLGKYRLVALNREEAIPFSVESIIGDFDSVEEAEKEAYRIELAKTTQFAIYDHALALEKSFERKLMK